MIWGVIGSGWELAGADFWLCRSDILPLASENRCQATESKLWPYRQHNRQQDYLNRVIAGTVDERGANVVKLRPEVA